MVKVKDTVTIIKDIDGYVSGVVTADLGNNQYRVFRFRDNTEGTYNVRDLSLSGGKRRTNKRKSRKSRKSRRSRR